MRKIFSSKYTSLITLIFLFFFLAAVSLFLSIPNKKTPEIKSKAAGLPAQAGNTLTVCTQGCQYAGPAGLQQAVDAASNGDIIFISKGTYSGPNETPVGVGWGTSGCFLDLRGKSLTLKGDGSPLGEFVGSVLYGEGHSKPADYVHRAGVCTTGGNITIDGLHIKEFQGRGLILKNANVVIKNSLIDGNDQGGLILTTNSNLLAVNNFFIRNLGIVTDRAGSVKAFNNTFYWSKAIVAASNCNDNVPPLDFKNNIVQDPELTIGIGGISTGCPDKVSQFKSQNIAYNVQWKEGGQCYQQEFCDNYTGKINADPMLDVAANDPLGWRGWGGNFGLKPESPAIGAGDPSIPGTRDLGGYGGPCADPNSSMCSTFISQQLVQLVPAATPTDILPTSPPYQPPPTGVNNTQPPGTQPTQPPPGENKPPITYYLPPTMSFESPSQPSDNQPTGSSPQNLPTPTITPTPKPLIDVKKTVDNVKNTWDNFITSLINFTKTVLP